MQKQKILDAGLVDLHGWEQDVGNHILFLLRNKIDGYKIKLF